MVHNGVEYGIMQAYAEGFNILHHGNLGSNYTKEGDAESSPMENPKDYEYDIDCAEVELALKKCSWFCCGQLVA